MISNRGWGSASLRRATWLKTDNLSECQFKKLLKGPRSKREEHIIDGCAFTHEGCHRKKQYTWNFAVHHIRGAVCWTHIDYSFQSYPHILFAISRKLLPLVHIFTPTLNTILRQWTRINSACFKIHQQRPPTASLMQTSYWFTKFN